MAPPQAKKPKSTATKARTTRKPAAKRKSAVRKVAPAPIPKSPWAKTQARYKQIVATPRFASAYLRGSLCVLLGTSVFWAVLSARVQQVNADQLVNPLLLENIKTFRGSLLPGSHSFLLKWPLFLLVKLFGYSKPAYIVITVAIVLATVGSLAYILYRIERRSLVFGTLCLALASSLLLVPTVPQAGSLLPVNMAMLTTRNIEYIVYIASLGLLVRSGRVKDRRFWLGAGLLALVIASDKLFLSLSIGGALLSLVAYAFTRGWNLVSQSVDWLLAGVSAAVFAAIGFWLIGATRLLHIVSSLGAGPYGLIHSAKDLVLGSFYGLLGLAANLGANPAINTGSIRSIFHQSLHQVFSAGGPSFLVNALILVSGLYAAGRILSASFAHNRGDKNATLDNATRLSIMLIWSTVAAAGLFVATKHYYAADARYLGIALFSLFIALATFGRGKNFSSDQLVLAGSILVVVSLISCTTVISHYHQDRQALKPIDDRTTLVEQALSHHRVDVLVGDYWRVLPARAGIQHPPIITPLGNCTQPRAILSSNNWQPDLKRHSFAYLLSLKQGLTDYPACSIDTVVSSYGRPNSSVVISGSLEKPEEILLFYDRGVRQSAPIITTTSGSPSTILPITVDELPHTGCSETTTLNIVAHQDDDLLFMNPDIAHDITSGRCVRTVYVTAGDAGAGSLYWLRREQGSEAAYDHMIGRQSIWVERVVKLASGSFIAVANPQGNSKVSLVFMRLPDGGLHGDGFYTTNLESLNRLLNGSTKRIHSVYGSSSYTSSDLVNALTKLMNVYQPALIRTQASYISSIYPDHTDHMKVGHYVQTAYTKYEKEHFDNLVTIPVKFYIGYPIHGRPQNVFGSELSQKQATFLQYAKFDNSVCQSIQQCDKNPTYGSYLQRQYQNVE